MNFLGETGQDKWVVEFFNSDPAISFTDKESVEKLIKLIKKL